MSNQAKNYIRNN